MLSRFARLLPHSSLSGCRSFSTRSADVSGYKSQVSAILGAQWGDEGKGKLVDILAKRYDIIARFNGGANAGHTLVVGGKKYAFHLLPCGMLYSGKVNVIGNGVVLDVPILMEECRKLVEGGANKQPLNSLKISDRAQLLFDVHKLIDGKQEAALKDKNIGTTKKGIGPCYASKAMRNGVRVGDLADWDGFVSKFKSLHTALYDQFKLSGDYRAELDRYKQYREQLMPSIVDTSFMLGEALRSGKTILAEGANAALLDLDHGTYPFVTSSNTSAGGICTGLGIPPTKIETVIGVVKAYTTRVGAGPFPTELEDAVGENMRARGHEFGTTTGRPRRCGWLDIPVLQYSHLLNDYASLNLTKLDILSELSEIKIAVAYTLDGKQLPPGRMPATLSDLARVKVVYESVPGWQCDISGAKSFEELPANAQTYVRRIEQLVGVPVSWVGVGAGRLDMATKGFKAQLD